MISFLFTLTFQAVLGEYFLVTPFHQQLEIAKRHDEVKIKDWDSTSVPVEDLSPHSSLQGQNARTLKITSVITTPEHFYQLIAMFPKLTHLSLKDVSLQRSSNHTCSCTYMTKLWNFKISNITFHFNDLDTDEKKAFFSELVKCSNSVSELKLDNSADFITELAENLMPGAIWARITHLSSVDCGLQKENFLTFLEHFPNVEWLTISSNTIGAAFEKWGPMVKMTYLIALHTNMTTKGLVHVIQTFPKLKLVAITGEALTDFTDVLPALSVYSRSDNQQLLLNVFELAEYENLEFCNITTASLKVWCTNRSK